MKQHAGPLLALAGLVAGIFTGDRASHALAIGALIAGASALAAAFAAQRRARVVLAMLGLACVGVSVSARANDGVRHPRLTGTAMLPTVLVDDPTSSAFGASVLVRAELGHGRHRTLLVTTSHDDAMRLRALEAGDRATLWGRFAPLRPTGFDERARVRHAIARLDDARLIAIQPPTGLIAVADRLRAEVLGGTRPLPPTMRALVAGFLLGDTRGIPPNVTAAYRDSGLSHLLAVSGENVAFVLALFAPLLRRLPLGGRTLLAGTVILVFAAMTRFEPSVLRACAMAAIALVATLVGRPASRVRVLAAAIIVLLIVDPFLARSVGFLLSCGASAGITFFEPALARRLRGPHFVREPLAVSLAAQLGVTPVLLVAFGRVPVVTPVANLVAAPAASALGAYGFVASAIGGAVSPLAPMLQGPTALLVTWVTAVARVGAAVPLTIDVPGMFALVALAAAIASIACMHAGRAVPGAAPG